MFSKRGSQLITPINFVSLSPSSIISMAPIIFVGTIHPGNKGWLEITKQSNSSPS